MKLIIGLGNPGKEYEKSRHNTGFIIVGRLVETKGLKWKFEKKFNAEIAKSESTIYAKPQTFMNKSGASVSKLVNYYIRSKIDDLIVVHDDVDLQSGEVKFQKGRGSAGHKGVQSIIKVLDSQDFWRFRVGIGRPKDNNTDVEKWILEDFQEFPNIGLELIDQY